MKHYVYAHLDDNGSPVYIGMGKNHRAWDVHGSRRKSGHREWMTDRLPELNVQIIASRVTREEAMSLEKILIEKLKPKFNAMYAHGYSLTEEAKHKMRESVKTLNASKKTCEYCGASMHPGLYARWHGENCKEK